MIAPNRNHGVSRKSAESDVEVHRALPNTENSRDSGHGVIDRREDPEENHPDRNSSA
jgi:hypothetical protein